MDREVVKISSLKAAPYNPRQISGEALAGLSKSLERWGVVQEIVANRRTGYIVGGHQRVAALRKMGVKEVPVVWVDLDEVEEKALNVALNNPHISGEFDDTIAGLLTEIRDGIGPDDFESLMLDDLLPTDATVVEGNTDPDDVPEAPEEPITKPGDLWVLGNHRLLCGDSTNIQHVERLMAGQNADMLHTDPPYGVDYEGVNNDSLKAEKLRSFLTDALTNGFAFLREGANAYVWHADIHAYEFIGAFRDSGFTQAKPCIIQWVKDSLVLSQGDYHLRNEPCLYGWKAGKNRIRVEDRKQDTIWEFPKPKKAEGHPTMKPVDLCRRAISNSSRQSDIVLDLFGGSGSTVIACEQDHRRAFLIELDPAYCDVTVKRWEDFTGKKATLEANDATG